MDKEKNDDEMLGTILQESKVSDILSDIDYEDEIDKAIINFVWDKYEEYGFHDAHTYYEDKWNWEVEKIVFDSIIEKIKSVYENIEQVDMWYEIVTLTEYVSSFFDVENLEA